MIKNHLIRNFFCTENDNTKKFHFISKKLVEEIPDSKKIETGRVDGLETCVENYVNWKHKNRFETKSGNIIRGWI